ncbi:unnamed protein product [Pipistrellus nathusii]|uniref:Uncharacterized protein n=1 Tax=Pipistrellus nathusii TaxID=59473 RepID=A0ABN9ZBE0_PIPNA
MILKLVVLAKCFALDILNLGRLFGMCENSNSFPVPTFLDPRMQNRTTHLNLTQESRILTLLWEMSTQGNKQHIASIVKLNNEVNRFIKVGTFIQPLQHSCLFSFKCLETGLTVGLSVVRTRCVFCL